MTAHPTEPQIVHHVINGTPVTFTVKFTNARIGDGKKRITVTGRVIEDLHVTDDPELAGHYIPDYRVTRTATAQEDPGGDQLDEDVTEQPFKRGTRAPVGLGGITEKEAFVFFLWLLGTPAFLPILEALSAYDDAVVLDGERRGENRKQTRRHVKAGRPRELCTRVILAAGFAVGATSPDRMHISAIAELLNQLPEDLKILIGWLNDKGNHGHPTTIARRLTAIVHGAGLIDHNHPILVAGKAIHPATGEILDHLVDYRVTLADLTQCGHDCPGRGGLQGIKNELLIALHDHLGTPDTGRVAIDSFPIETHYAAKTHGALAEIDPLNLPDTVRPDDVPTRDQKDTAKDKP